MLRKKEAGKLFSSDVQLPQQGIVYAWSREDVLSGYYQRLPERWKKAIARINAESRVYMVSELCDEFGFERDEAYLFIERVGKMGLINLLALFSNFYGFVEYVFGRILEATPVIHADHQFSIGISVKYCF